MTDQEYRAALHRCEVLMALDPHPDSRYGRELIRIAGLVEDYELGVSPDEYSARDGHETQRQ